jgi:hypothetical protein
MHSRLVITHYIMFTQVSSVGRRAVGTEATSVRILSSALAHRDLFLFISTLTIIGQMDASSLYPYWIRALPSNLINLLASSQLAKHFIL